MIKKYLKILLCFTLIFTFVFSDPITAFASEYFYSFSNSAYSYDNSSYTTVDLETTGFQIKSSSTNYFWFKGSIYDDFGKVSIAPGTYNITVQFQTLVSHELANIRNAAGYIWFSDYSGNRFANFNYSNSVSVDKGLDSSGRKMHLHSLEFNGVVLDEACYIQELYLNVYSNVNGNCKIPYIILTVDEIDTTEQNVSGILGFVKSIWEGITNLPGKITSGLSTFFSNVVNAVTNLPNALKGFFDNIVNSITSMVTALKDKLQGVLDGIVNKLTDLGNFIINGLKGLFIPDNDFFSTYFDNLYDFFTEKLGVLIYPFTIIVRVLNCYANLGNGSGLINIPSYSFMGVNLWSSTTYDLKGAMSSILGSYYSIYYAFVDCIIIFLFINFCLKKFNSIVGGGVE